MLVSPSEDIVVSSMGWADGGKLHVVETGTGIISLLPISDAKYLAVFAGTEGHFSVLHVNDGRWARISVHSFRDPSLSLAQLELAEGKPRFAGDHSRWRYVPRVYVTYLIRPSGDAPYLIVVDRVKEAAEVRWLSWYDSSYDKGYQGVIGVEELPFDDQVLFSVQRDSKLVLADLGTGEMIRKVELAGRGGNATLHFLRNGTEMWANDYDTLVRVDARNWEVMGQRHLQDPAGVTRQFVGEMAFDRHEAICAVARPFSGDVVGISTETFAVVSAARFQFSPLQVAVLSDNRLFSRDWKTGVLAMETLKPI